ncbi:F0F1 ATP synthase subunit I [Affinibrenneria salicis]|uniref:F0F1 ATP synthase subunit I n=1 Tax=Affinibrenneria salicis TaxID=2590031 RepID=A0A5J5FQ99_9GAMM|nr:F0F1 ATP synthase subunit I [Affinibrenneria salicis]KAA8995149.1 F0F1 ATP synthase subunit I [Affinibrenneria salicis]
MPVSLYSGKVALRLLLLQLVTFALVSALFCFNSMAWGASAFGGGLAAWLPNVMFVLFALRHQAGTPAEGRLAWSFVIGEALKVAIAIILLVVALGVFHAALIPLGLAYLSVLVTQIVAPAVIKQLP